jgi:hypothetical protein
MGVALWLGGGLAAFLLARIIPLGRPPGRVAELAIATVTALVLGVGATAMDFGGWAEADWRACAFALLGALAAVGLIRASRA